MGISFPIRAGFVSSERRFLRSRLRAIRRICMHELFKIIFHSGARNSLSFIIYYLLHARDVSTAKLKSGHGWTSNLLPVRKFIRLPGACYYGVVEWCETLIFRFLSAGISQESACRCFSNNLQWNTQGQWSNSGLNLLIDILISIYHLQL